MIKKILGIVKSRRKNRQRQNEWRARNSKNFTTLGSLTDMDLIKVGDYTYGKIYCMCYKKGAYLSIGKYCSIAPEVTFILNADHNINLLSTFPFDSRLNLQIGKNDLHSKGDIVLEDDVWIGYRSTIFSGVHIGQGAIVSAGSVVTKDVPPYAIVGGVPARVIKYRFPGSIIKKLLKIDYSKIEPETVKKNKDMFYSEINENNIDLIINSLPQKIRENS